MLARARLWRGACARARVFGHVLMSEGREGPAPIARSMNAPRQKDV